MTKIKICGLMRMEDVEAVNRYKPDFAGFVFAPGRRRLTLEQARALIRGLDTSIVPVGVFADEREEFVAAITQVCGLRAVQMHGSEDHAYLSRLQAILPQGAKIIKAVRIKDMTSVKEAESITGCDLLLDAWSEAQPGGAGKTFDWRLLEGFALSYLLAGGLNAGNVEKAIKTLHPFGVDVSSGVETEGRKDAAKIDEFIQLVRSIGI